MKNPLRVKRRRAFWSILSTEIAENMERSSDLSICYGVEYHEEVGIRENSAITALVSYWIVFIFFPAKQSVCIVIYLDDYQRGMDTDLQFQANADGNLRSEDHLVTQVERRIIR